MAISATILEKRAGISKEQSAKYRQMEASWETLHLLAGGVPIRLGCGPHGREACLHYFTEGTGMLVLAWLDGAAWGVQPVTYHVQGAVITGPTSPLPTRKR